ncbi:MAG: VWA domain-containing protein [Pyrinomonadaceae bacterium]|nr:VWA domain-containing protein [Pyrinomonadaceae bacterium]
MRKFTIGFVLILSFVVVGLSQSGRRIATKATPIPTTIERAEDVYSESRPYKPVRVYPRDYKKKKKKKKKKSKKRSQKQAVTNQTTDDPDLIKVDSTLVTIPISVHDRNGLYIPDLRQNEIKIFEDGKEQEIAYFGSSEKPFTVVLLLDTSPSTEYRIEEIQRASRAFVDQLKPEDSVMVIEFDANVHVLTEATKDRKKIYKAIRKADFGGGTSLYDAVEFSLEKRLEKIEGRKAIVLFTDGVDTTSRGADYGENIVEMEESDVLVFPIYYNTYLDNRRGRNPFPRRGGIFGRAPIGTRPEDYALGKQYLEELAAVTGGRVFTPNKTPGGLTKAFEGIAEELRRQYNIGYYPSKEGVPGERRKIKVRVYRPKLIIRARDSYIVGDNKVADN